jgi:hypothetical protein
MVIPRWVTFVIAALVFLFGAYRLYVGLFTPAERLAQRQGLYGRSRRAHVIYGVLYLLLSAMVVASAFGYNPLD